jgi:hypothetical protein
VFDLCACAAALCECLDYESVLSHCVAKIGSFDHQVAIKYGQHYGYFDVNGDVTPSGIVLAKFIGVLGEAELAELQLMQAKDGDLSFAKAA